MKTHLIASGRPNFMETTPLYHEFNKRKGFEPIGMVESRLGIKTLIQRHDSPFQGIAESMNFLPKILL